MEIQRLIEVDSAMAFGALGKAGMMMPGRNYAATAPYMPLEIPDYVFDEDSFSALRYIWAREHSRADYKPRLGVLVMGPKGCGKTTGLEQFFQRLNVPVPSFTAHRRLTVDDLLGSKTMSGGEVLFENGPLTFAMENGLPFILNEIDLVAPDELAGLNDVAERGVAIRSDGSVIQAQRGFVFLATMNTKGSGDTDGSYAGTQVMNKAFMSRFLKLTAKYPSPSVERDILCKAVPGLQPSEAARFVEVANLIRKAYMGNGSGPPIEETLSTRELIVWGDLVSVFKAKRQDAAQYAMNLVLTNACEGPTATAITSFVQLQFP